MTLKEKNIALEDKLLAATNLLNRCKLIIDESNKEAYDRGDYPNITIIDDITKFQKAVGIEPERECDLFYKYMKHLSTQKAKSNTLTSEKYKIEIVNTAMGIGTRKLGSSDGFAITGLSFKNFLTNMKFEVEEFKKKFNK